MKRIFSLFLGMVFLFMGASSAAAATPTPAPLEITKEVVSQVPDQIQRLLDLAYAEWEAGDGNELKKRNKYTDWNGSKTGYGWCGGFITWCTLEVGIPQQSWKKTPVGDAEGVVHVNEAGVGKLVTGYSRMNRTTMIPQKGFICVFGNRDTKFAGLTPLYHVGLVYDVEKLPDGRYRVTTIEGNVSSPGDDTHKKAAHAIRMFVRDYDPSAPKKDNLTLVPEEERNREENASFSYHYTYNNPSLYVHMYLMPWIPDT